MLRRIHYLKKNLKEENINWIQEDHFHITIKFLGKTPSDQIEEVSRILQGVSENQASFEMSVEKVALFGSQYHPRVIWMGVEPESILRGIHESITDGLESIGLKKDRQNFVPHLSIARIRKLNNKDHFRKVFEKVEQGMIQKEMVRSIILYESILHPKGAEYRIVKEFPLIGL